MMHQEDGRQRLLIVGGGPAGLAAALLLARAGMPVVVVDKGSWPQEKVCGEGVMPPGVAFLQQHGILQAISPNMRQPFRGICYRGPHGVVAQADFASGHGVGIRRTALSQALVDTVRSHPLVTLRPHTTLRDLCATSTAVQVTLQQRHAGPADSHETFACVIGADGLRSAVRRYAGLCGPAPGLQQRWGARQHFALTPWSEYVEVWWQRGIEAYITPCGTHQVGIAFLWDRTRFRPQHRGIAGFLAPFPALAARVQGATPLSAFSGLGPLAVAATHPVAAGVILLGDALVFLDGITGEGLSLSFAQAALLAEHLPSLLRGQALSRENLQPLARALMAQTTPYVTMTRLALHLALHPWLRTGVLRALSRSPRMFQHLLDVTMGRRALWRVPLPAMAPLGWGLLSPRRVHD